LTYNDANQLLTGSYTGGTLAGLSVNNTYNGYLQRETVTARNGGTTLQGATYGYDTAGRLLTVTDSPYVATYAYQPNSLLLNTVTFKNGATTNWVTSRQYDRLNRLQSIANLNAQASTLNSFGYAYNSANQRTRATLADGSYWVYRYDTLGQVTSGKRYWSDGTPVAGPRFIYVEGSIGNRRAVATSVFGKGS
jgi:YD repeat-containing protein